MLKTLLVVDAGGRGWQKQREKEAKRHLDYELDTGIIQRVKQPPKDYLNF